MASVSGRLPAPDLGDHRRQVGLGVDLLGPRAAQSVTKPEGARPRHRPGVGGRDEAGVDHVAAPGAMMKALGQRYVPYVNRLYRRSGTLWEGRFRSCPIQEEAYLLACQRYIELNPVRATMVEHPADYRWSSYRANAQGEDDRQVSPHRLYVALGDTAEHRQAAYRELFRHDLEPGLVDQIRAATNGNFLLGNARFAAEIEATLGRRVSPGTPGRPRKPLVPRSKDLF